MSPYERKLRLNYQLWCARRHPHWQHRLLARMVMQQYLRDNRRGSTPHEYERTPQAAAWRHAGLGLRPWLNGSWSGRQLAGALYHRVHP